MADNDQATADGEAAPAPAPDDNAPPPGSQTPNTQGGDDDGDEDEGYSLRDAIDELEGPAKSKKADADEGDEGEGEGEGEGGEGEGDDGTALELIDVEYEGASFKIPKAAEAAFLRAEDYGKKVVEFNERVEKHSKQETQFREFAQTMEESRQELAYIAAIDMQLADYNELDWDALQEADPSEAMKHDRRRNDLIRQREQLVGAVTAKQQERAKATETRLAEQQKATSAELARRIPGWGPDKQKQLTEAAAANGLDPRRVEAAIKLDPEGAVLLGILHKAAKYDQLVAKSRSAKRKGPEPKPAARVSGRRSSGSSAQPSDKDSVDDWVAKREKQLAAAGRQ